MTESPAKPPSSPVTEDEVRLAYKLILGREPENDIVVQEKAGSVSTLEELRADLITSAEFSNRHLKVPSVCVSGVEPKLNIETTEDFDQSTLASLFRRVKQSWSRLGDVEPYWSVWTDDRFKGRDLGKHHAEFFESGSVHLDYLLKTLERNGVQWNRLKTCLELGCGVARFTPFLAYAFDFVHAYDVSRGHLRIAQSVLSNAGVQNVECRLLEDPQDFHHLPQVDLVYSLVVLQHNPPPLIEWMLQGMLSALSPGGVAYFQVPTYLKGYSFRLADYLNSPPRSDELEMHAIPQSRVFRLVQKNHCEVVEVLEDGWTIPEIGNRSNTFVVAKAE
jgi:SAM-dependent methyltransferase